jgi:hypothetical protein
MNQGVGLVRFEGDESKTVAQMSSAQLELKHFQNVTNSVVQEALNIWADLWAELESDVACGVALTSPEKGSETPDAKTRDQGGPGVPNAKVGVGEPLPSAKDGTWGPGPIQPSCGWPEFLEKMWILRQNLDFLARFSRR